MRTEKTVTYVPKDAAPMKVVVQLIDLTFLWRVAVWIAVGFLVHWMLYGEMSWTGIFSWAVVVLWPLFLFLAFVKWALILGAAGLAVWFVWRWLRG